MTPTEPLAANQLYNRCELTEFDFETTDDLENLDGFIGQDRAITAIQFGVSVNRQGYNIFALGPSGTGKQTLVSSFVEQRAGGEPSPSAWCYVNNFEQPYRPRAVRLPAGKGREFVQDMERLVEDLQSALSSAFESEEYQARRQALEEEFREQQQQQLMELQERAKESDLTLLRTQAGLAFAPLRDGNVLEPEEYDKLPEEERKQIQARVEALQEQLQKVLYQVPRWEREMRDRLKVLNQEVSSFVLGDLVDDLAKKYENIPDVLTYLTAVRKDVNENLSDFLSSEEKQRQIPGVEMTAVSPSPMHRFQVNVLVDPGDAEGAPVIYESNPSYLNLVGRVEQMAQMGALVTDFTLIKPGTLHRANGGYLILDAAKVITSPYAWEGLKRALQFQEIRIESPLQMLSLTSTVSLEPEPIALDIKVVLTGDRQLYYLLAAYDPDFRELFKVAADFDDEFMRAKQTQDLYARLIATIARDEQLCPFDRSAVCRIIEHSARMAGDSERLTARMETIVDLLEEADHWAREAGDETVRAAHVQQAIDAQIYRSDRVRQHTQDSILRKTVLIDSDGDKVGQINGLAVLQLGNFAFGKPSRITATVRMGKGDVVDIEREVEMGGPLHSKGVLILSSFLQARYAAESQLSLSASLVFEQSYGGVDGDSASSAELYALLSAISGVPIKQSLAVTGSVNQHGQVQAIGGVNEKIEGFFDLCRARGLTGRQGVLIPVANVKHLMLRHDVVDAVANEKFHIYPIETINQGVEVLTGVPAGVCDDEGKYPPGSINRLVADRLAYLIQKRKALSDDEKADDDASEGAAT